MFGSLFNLHLHSLPRSKPSHIINRKYLVNWVRRHHLITAGLRLTDLFWICNINHIEIVECRGFWVFGGWGLGHNWFIINIIFIFILVVCPHPTLLLSLFSLVVFPYPLICHSYYDIYYTWFILNSYTHYLVDWINSCIDMIYIAYDLYCIWYKLYTQYLSHFQILWIKKYSK